MGLERYEQLDLPRPAYLGDGHWAAIALETERLERSIEAGDRGQVIGDAKCMVESIARVTHDLAGQPTEPNDAFNTTVKAAHRLLKYQPGYGLTDHTSFGDLATQAMKIVLNLDRIRNDFGGGHGKAHKPVVEDEMVELVLDGTLLWARWALRRLGLFSEGRPELLIRDLVEQNATFYRGDLGRRLMAANLKTLAPHHQRELGMAVGQRCMQGTYVVRWDGLDPCLASDSLEHWPAEFRIGLANGLWFSRDGYPTVTAASLRDGISVLDPVPDAAQPMSELVARVWESTEETLPREDRDAVAATADLIRERARHSSPDDQEWLERLLWHLEPPEPPF